MKNKLWVLILWLPVYLAGQPAELQYDHGVLETVSAPYDISEYFLLLPDSVFNALTLGGKGQFDAAFRAELLISTQREVYEKGYPFYLSDQELNSGYLRISSVGDGAGEYLEMTYWNCTNGERLIAVNIGEWAMCCESSTPYFFQFKEGEWSQAKDPLPDMGIEDFMYPSIAELDPGFLFEDASFLYELPRQGKDIRVHLDTNAIEYIETDLNWDEQLKWVEKVYKHIRQEEIELKWADGSFEKPLKP